ncbi:MAG: TolC family protein [Reichenbachiella sp.]|uniref:TolC family protein n=1 Tax=Reichenbachiella sp. TaxID=2184521 RepID=UPI002966B59D|nr:TolC family protein [Reichenbachiella sp.]MDW3212155.1 TolC family protein [Reichenbachiella sp.]
MKFTIKNTYSWLLILLLIVTKVNAQEAQDPTIEYLKIAAENNPELKAVFNQYLATLERMPQARALPDPTVMFNIFTSPVETRVGAQNAGISLSQAFPWFGQLKSQERAVAQLAKARFEAFEETKNRLFFDVRSEYFDLYVLEAAIDIVEENIVLLESFRELASVRLESATGSAVDLLRVEMDLEELNNQLLYLQDTRSPIQAKFNELLNTENPLDIAIPDSLATIAFSEGKNILLDSIVAQNPLLRGLDFELQALDAEIDVAQKMGLPSFNLGVSYTNISPRSGVDIPDNGKDALIFPQVGVRIPLYRKKYQSMVKEKELLRTSVTYKKEDKTNELETSLEKGWRDYSDAVRRVGLYQRLMRYANQSLDILIAQYTTAGSDFEEVLRMERQLLRYELELEKARADQNTFVAYINYLTGKQL